ncbi:MAG TPA: response regulator [Bryobacteraceae bacterium]|nr:response regulator [Bryobacteraceae bacterium]
MAFGIYSLAFLILLFGRSVLFAWQAPTPAEGPPLVSLRSIQERHAPAYTPVRIGQRVTVSGVVATRAVNFGEYAHLPIQGDENFGLFIERARGALDAFSPGDVIQATGVVGHRSGPPVLVADSISKQGERQPPKPQKLQIADLTKFENIGKYIAVDAFILAAGQNAGGDVIIIGGGKNTPISVFYPRFHRWSGPGLHKYEPGDQIRVTALASQYCPVEPYDRGFQLVVDDPSQLLLLERGWMIPPGIVLYLLVTMLFAIGVWWMREHRMAEQRRTIRSMMSLSEEVLSANSVGEISRKIQAVLPNLLKAWKIDLYLLNRIRSTLDRIPDDISAEPVTIAIEQPEGTMAAAVALCFRNRALLTVPDFRKSPLIEFPKHFDLPASAVFVPMFAQRDVLGVVAVQFRVRLKTNRNQQAALQHVANQIAASLRLQEQQSIREQLLRTEKMAAAGQLISAVAHDLRAPLNAIREAATRIRGERNGNEEMEITAEAERGLQIVTHLLSFARLERSEARAVNLHELVTGVMEAREPEWLRKGLHVENTLPVTPVEVFVDESELEQVVLSLLIQVEHTVENYAGNRVRVSSRVLGTRVQIAIDFEGPAEVSDTPDEPTPGDAFSLPVCQAIAQSHGGDIRLFQTPQGGYRYELELPVHHAPLPTEVSIAPPSRHASRVLTVILIEPDAPLQRRLLAMLSVRGHRAIPVDSAEEAVDMVQRMPFDVIFCTVRLPGLSWIEFYKRVRRRISVFVALTENYDTDAGGVLKDGAGFVLCKPIEESELDGVLADVEARHGSRH